MKENAKYYSTTCAKIGLAMLLFYAFFTLSTYAVYIVADILAEFFENEFYLEAITNFLFALTYFLSFSVPAFILRKMCKSLPSSRPIYTSFKFNGWIFAAIIAVIAVNFSLSYLNNITITSFLPDSVVNSVSSSTDIAKDHSMSEIWILFLIEVLATAIVPALCEEYLFRGAVLTNLLPFGKTTAIFASAVLFGFMHQNPFQILYTLLMGVIIGYIYVKTKSIWACVILHFMNNMITVLEDYLPIFTGREWIMVLVELIIIFGGGLALLLIMLRKNKEPSPQFEGSYGRVYERGFEHEEIVLDLPAGQKLRKFFTPTIIIFVIICMLSIVNTMLSVYGISLT